MSPREPLAHDVRAARPGDESAIGRVCRAGLGLSSRGLLPPDVVERQAAHCYGIERVRQEIAPRPRDPAWQGYSVAESSQGVVLGAAARGFVERGEVPYVAANSDEPSGTTLRMCRPVPASRASLRPGAGV